MDLFGIGKNVTIKTSNGQLYTAFISTMNTSTKLVTLVWFQEGKTISKEIKLTQILNEPIILIDHDFNDDVIDGIRQDGISEIQNLQEELKQNQEKRQQLQPQYQISTSSKENTISNELSNLSDNSDNSDNNKNIEEFKSDTKFDINMSIKKRPSSCTLLINELKQHKLKIFQNTKIDLQLNNNNNNNINNSTDDDNFDEDDDFSTENKSIKFIQSCHCPESEVSLKSKLSIRDILFDMKINSSNKINSVNSINSINSINRSNNILKSIDNDNKKTQSNITNSLNNSCLSIQKSFKGVLNKKEEELQKKITSNQFLKRKKNELLTLNLGDPSRDTLAMVREYKMSLKYEPLYVNYDESIFNNNAITVCVRKRPLTTNEYLQNDIDIISIPNKELIIVHELKTKVNLRKYLDNQKFRFDYGFDETCNNETVYNYTAKPLINTIFNGGMATLFAYGQTGAGKTYTVGGNSSQTNSEDGICALAAKDIFERLNNNNNNFKVSASFYEIYNGKIYDLLAEKKLLTVLEDGRHKVNIIGLSEKVVTQYDDVLHLIEYGNNIRATGESSVNKHSSRSHAIFQIILRNKNISKVYGKFSFIDLAGNERGCDSISTNRYEMIEAAGINTSLLALKECIRAMGKEKAHLPFRASKLTQVLKDSFTGKNSKTCMIAMISPGLSSCQYTLNTLRYADRVKELDAKRGNSTKRRKTIIKNKSKTNQLLPYNCISRY